MNLLLLCTYPIQTPMHGGQLRARAIAESYRSAGCAVQVAGVLGSDSYPSERGFDGFPGAARLAQVLPNPFLMEDYAIGELYATDAERFERLRRKIEGQPDIIHVEQPWLFGFAQRLRRECGWSAPLIYGSQNIEHRLKEAILSTYSDTRQARENARLIEDLERRVIAEADAVVCVSAGDLQWTREQSARPVVLAANGVQPWQPTSAGRTEAGRLTGGLQFALYCGSAHPPNMTGFFAMLGDGFGSLAPDQRLVIAGSVGHALAADPRIHHSAHLAARSLIAGMVPQATLEGLLELAHCVVLPLTQGGGTNLKTAEALWTGKHIVGTSVAFRGFEAFREGAGVQIADTPRDFKQALRRAMQSPALQLTAAEREARRVVLWQECLRALPALAHQLTAATRG